jgi:hypothetical protein
MEDKYNHLSVAAYGSNLAKSLCDHYFTKEQTVNGPQLMNFTPIRQVNLFVVKELLVQWQQEMGNLKSPYFDFQNEEVRAALVQFMNVLSRKILINRPQFEPLLSKAIYDTFMVVLDPVSVFDEKFLRQVEEITPSSLQDSLKYLDIEKKLVANFVHALSPSRMERLFILDSFREYIQEHNQERTSIALLLAQFDQLLPISRLDITGKSPLVGREDDKPHTKGPVSSPSEPSVPSQTKAAAAPAAPAKHALATESNLNEKFKVEKPSRAEAYAKATTSSLAESQTNKPIQSLKESISINQRYGFINELFNGENQDYHATIKKLDEFAEADDAKNYLLKEVAVRYDWAKKEEHVNKLLKLIDRKFTS